MHLNTFNDWDNKFTWLIDTHLSNEANLYNEVTELVAGEADNASAGQRLEMWVKASIANWLASLPGRSRKYDEEMRLMVWDLVASALAYADWDNLVGVLDGEAEMGDNLFTLTLHRTIVNNQQLQQNVMVLVEGAYSLYAGIDAVKEWFELQVDTWITTPAARQHGNSPMSVLAHDLIESAYTVINWEHVARAFREV